MAAPAKSKRWQTLSDYHTDGCFGQMGKPHIIVAEVAAATSGNTPISNMRGPCVRRDWLSHQVVSMNRDRPCLQVIHDAIRG